MRNRSNCLSEFLKRLPRTRRAYGSECGERTINNLREPGRPSFARPRSLTFIPTLTLSGRRLAGRGVKFAKFLSEKRPRKYQIAALGVASFASSIVAEFKGELRGFLFRERARIISDLPRSDPAKSHVQGLSVALGSRSIMLIATINARALRKTESRKDSANFNTLAARNADIETKPNSPRNPTRPNWPSVIVQRPSVTLKSAPPPPSKTSKTRLRPYRPHPNKTRCDASSQSPA